MIRPVLILGFSLAFAFSAISHRLLGSDAGTAEQRLVEGNNLGVALVKQGKYREAVEQFRKLDLPAAKSYRFVYESNFARALEGNGDFKEAYTKYKFAITLQPKFDDAADGAFRILQDGKLKDSAPEEAASLVQLLLDQDNGNPELAGRQLHKSLEVWPGSAQLLQLLVRYYVIAPIDLERFQRDESEFLGSLKTRSSLDWMISEIQKAYTADFIPTFHRPQTEFLEWFDPSDFSRLLKSIGDFYNQQGDRKKALERYTLAVAIDLGNSEACLYSAAMLRDYRAELDPSRTLFDQLIDEMFSEKMLLYRGVHAKPADWLNILRSHIVLGTIFEKEKVWGSEGEPRSAVFQWQHAADAEKKVREYDPSLPPSPGIHLGLANAYNHAKRRSQARKEYLIAAQGFIDSSRKRLAMRALNQAKALGGESSDKARFQKLLASAQEVSQSVHTLVFGIVAKSNNNPMFQAAKTGAEDEAKALGEKNGMTITIDWRTPNEEDPQKQVEAIEQLVNAGVSGIAVSASDADKLIGAIDGAVAKGVPVVCFDSDVPKSKRLAYFGTDDIECGYKVMAELAKEMNGKGVVAILAGNQNAPNLQKRVAGVKEEATKSPGIKIIETYYHKETPQDAAAKVEQVMQAHPEITGWAMVGGWPLFTDNALKFSPGSVKVVAVDALPAELYYLRDGHVQVLLAQQVYEWGTKSVEMLYNKAANHKDPPSRFLKADLIPVTKANVDEFAKVWRKWLPK